MHWFPRCTTLAALAIPSIILAGVPESKPIRESRVDAPVTAGRVAMLGEAGRIVGHWREFQRTTQETSWTTAFDSMSFNPLTNQPFSGVYGPTAGFYRWSNTYRNPYFCNDITVSAGTGGQVANRFIYDCVWNPAGTPNRSGSMRMATAVLCSQEFGFTTSADSWSQPLGFGTGDFVGIVIDWGVQPAGWRTYDADLTGTGLGIPLPSSSGSIVVVTGVITEDEVFRIPPPGVATQPTLDNMASPSDPQFPGTNPSRSGPLQWDDDNGSILQSQFDGIHQNLRNTSYLTSPYYELTTYDYTDSFLGVSQACTALMINNSTAPGGAAPSFGGLIGGTAHDRLTFHMVATNGRRQIIRNEYGERLETSWHAARNANGEYSLLAPGFLHPRSGRQIGNYYVTLKPEGFLRETVWVDFLKEDLLVGLSLLPGDVDDDNEVSSQDLGLFLMAYGSTEGESSYSRSADFNLDGSVDTIDFIGLALSYGRSGDFEP